MSSHAVTDLSELPGSGDDPSSAPTLVSLFLGFAIVLATVFFVEYFTDNAINQLRATPPQGTSPVERLKAEQESGLRGLEGAKRRVIKKYGQRG